MEDPSARRLALAGAIAAALIALLPYLFAEFAARPVGFAYAGSQTAVDDTMVYAAWMRQAAEGHLLFDNRFAVDPQPGLTFHLWFLVLGWLSKLTGMPLALALGRAVFSGLFVWALYGLLKRLTDDGYFQKLGLVLGVFGGGIGFAVWQNFGQTSSALNGVMMGRLPIDVWQTEAFVMPSMLVNGLFMVSLWLILTIWNCVLDARESSAPVLKGALAFLVLANIHSYDVLLVGMVLVGLLVSCLGQGTLTKAWLGRTALMAAGAIPPALWMGYVLSKDPVFQARAATLTYSPNFRQIVFGCLLLIGLAFAWLLKGRETDRQKAGAAMAAIVLLALFGFAGAHTDTNQYWVGSLLWVLMYGVALAVCWLLASKNPARSLVVSWGAVGLVAPYFPALFQRKLAMGIQVPWAIMAAGGMALVLFKLDKSMRNLVAALLIILTGATSVRWLSREMDFARRNVSSTTVHSVYLSPEVIKIMGLLGSQPGRKTVLAMPGVASPEGAEFESPYLADLNPIASGLAGAYSYAGHWSETPDYLKRRNEAVRFFLEATSDEQRRSFLHEHQIGWLIAPVPAAYPALKEAGQPLADVSGLGETAYAGRRFRLVRVRD